MVAGESLQDERTNGGAFIGTDGLQFPQKLIPVRSMKLLFVFFSCYQCGENIKILLIYANQSPFGVSVTYFAQPLTLILCLVH